MRIIAVANQKGGCGKTTTAVNLSAALASLGHRVLLVDLDTQGHAGFGLGVASDQVSCGLYDVLSPATPDPRPLREILIPINLNLHLAPSQILMAALEQELAGRPGREDRLAEALAPLAGQFDFALIDCAPGLGVLTFNALRAADELLIPVEASVFSLHGIGKFMETVLLAESRFGKRFRLHVLPTLFDHRTRLAREIHEELSRYFQDLLLNVALRRNVRLADAAAAGRSIMSFDRHCHGYEDYLRLASELIQRDADHLDQRRPAWLANADALRAPIALSHRTPERAEDAPVPIEIPVAEAVARPGTIRIAGLDGDGTPHPDRVPLEVQLGPRRRGDQTCFMLQHPNSGRVQLAGDFNNWQPEPLVAGNDGIWRTMLHLSPGDYRYKYIIDGAWINDPGNEQTAPNPYGGFDSILTIAR
jgi:chromosome partitioning protein